MFKIVNDVDNIELSKLCKSKKTIWFTNKQHFWIFSDHFIERFG